MPNELSLAMQNESETAAEPEAFDRVPSKLVAAGELSISDLKTRALLSVIVPVYKEEGNIDQRPRYIVGRVEGLLAASKNA